jgi:hypothetical protein
MSNVRQIGLDRVDNVGHFFYVVKYRPNVAYIMAVGLFILLYFHMPWPHTGSYRTINMVLCVRVGILGSLFLYYYSHGKSKH